MSLHASGRPEYDLAVVGLGTAGAAVAALGAQAGMKILGVDLRPLDEAGARWVNGVPEWCFAEAGLASPTGPERRGGGARFHLLAGRGPQRIIMDGHDVLDVDMRLLVARLHSQALQQGAELRTVKSAQYDNGQLIVDGRPVSAEVVVDASGMNGVQALGHPKPPAADVCAAAQQVHQVADRQRALGFFALHEVAEGETLCFSGLAGGYSIVNLRLEGDEVSILTGSLPARGNVSGRALLQSVLDDNSWIGPRVFGGARAIPLSMPPAWVGRGRCAAVGDAGGQVFTAHGSGIGMGMIAANTLVQCLAAGGSAWDYNVRWMRRWGSLLAGYEVFRAFSSTLHEDEVRSLIVHGVMDPMLSGAALDQRPAPVQVRSLGPKVKALMRAGALGRRVGRVLATMGAAQLVYAAYPSNPRALRGWRLLRQRVLP